MTLDFSPIMGWPIPGVRVCSSSRRGTYGVEAELAAGEAMTELIATGKTPELIAAPDLARFADGRFVGEKGVAAVGH
jgi:sarcosine oxidase, subunit beta